MVQFYEEWYKKLISHSNEKDLLVTKIVDLIQGKGHKNCLEIGLGTSPYFAEKLSPFFESYTIVESRTYSGNLPANVKLIESDWESVSIDEKFDVILASHVIYYFNDTPKAIQKMFDHLTENGRIFFVVNGKESDYGPIKLAFADMIGKTYTFTYDSLLSTLKGNKIREYTTQANLSFSSPEELYEILKLSFDLYPTEYATNKDRVISYLRDNVKGNKFFIDQKIIEVTK